MIEIGAKLTVEKTVTPELTAQVAGSGLLPVFGTPYMTALMENAAMPASSSSYLEEGQGSVGTHLDVSHDAPTPVGMKVWAEAEITAVSENGKMVDFRRKGLGRDRPHRQRAPTPGPSSPTTSFLSQVQRASWNSKNGFS